MKTYIPKSKARAVSTEFGEILKLGFHAETLVAFVKQHANSAGYINLDIVPRRETDQYGNTHSVVLNDWKPTGAKPATEKPKSAQPTESDEPPF